jgi:flagellar protein FliS
MAGHPVNPYLRTAVMTAPPEQLQLMLYDGAIRFASQGKEAILAKDFERSFEKLTRAQHILLEMKKGLRYEVNPELCGRVDAIYTFLYNKLVDACVKREPAFVDDALRVLKIERDTWQILCDKVAGLRSEQAKASDTSSGKDQPALSLEG